MFLLDLEDLDIELQVEHEDQEDKDNWGGTLCYLDEWWKNFVLLWIVLGFSCYLDYSIRMITNLFSRKHKLILSFVYKKYINDNFF